MHGVQPPFSLAYQPIISTRNGKVIALEALTRVQLPLIGNVSPLRFIEFTETARLSLFHTRWVLREACFLGAKWQCAHRPLRICVNVSAGNLVKPQFTSVVEASLRDSGLYPSNLQLEVTETMLVRSNRHTRDQLWRLRQNGVRIAIDDFGTGFSSLRSVLEMPADVIKLDRCFVRELETSAKSRAVMRSTIALAHELRMEVVAEGVEAEKQRTLLRESECDSIQGFLISAPLPLDDLTPLLTERSERGRGDESRGRRISPVADPETQTGTSRAAASAGLAGTPPGLSVAFR